MMTEAGILAYCRSLGLEPHTLEDARFLAQMPVLIRLEELRYQLDHIGFAVPVNDPNFDELMVAQVLQRAL